MARKYELINDLYDQIIVDVTKEARAWQSFLRTACRNYKLRFDEQLLLFAQRPDATAVLEIERWNTAFGRWVNRGAKGIAVFEDSTGESQRLKYYFDIADTHGTEQSREVPVWKMSEEYQSNVAEALKNAFGTSTDSDDLRIVIKESVVNAVDDNIDDYIYGFVKSGTGSEIDYMKPEDAEEIYKRIVTNSVLYMIYERLGMDNLLTDDDFNGIEYFSTPELLNSIGYATGDIARMGLGIVSKTIRSTKKEKQQVIQPVINKISDNERSSYNERNHLHNAGRLSDSGSDITDTTGSYSRQMGRDEERISEAASQSNVLQSDDKRSVDAVSRRRGTESTEAGGQTDERNVGNTGADGRIESKRHDEMGTADEQSAQRSAGDSYSADNNERLSNYKPLPSIEEQTAFIEEFKAEVAKASAFSIPNEIINDHLANGSGFRDGKYRIYEQFRKSLSQKENADFLKNEYGIGGGTHAGGVSGYYYDHNAKGICISKGFADNATRINLNWLEVAKRIQLLINNDRYLNEKEKEHYAQWLNEREERQYTEQGLSTSENKDNEKYIYKVGDTVFIGASEYRITAKDDQQVMLSDANAPLFNKQYDIADFEHKIKENALNEHLKVILSEEESNTSVISETNTTPINDDDYYFNDAERKEVVAVYYNPDAISGGQFVFAHITYELISKAKDVASDTDSFYEYLDENAYTELIDVGTEEYRTVLSEYSDPNPDFIGRNEENMLQLIALAKNEKITYDKNGYHADDLDEGDLIKVDGEIWAVKSVSSYSISLINESGDKKYISNSPDSKWQETLVSRYNFEFIGNREGTNTQVNNESTDSKQSKTAHEHKKNRKQNNAPSVLYPEINNDYRTNFHIDTDELGAGTPLERYYNNINAIRLLKKLNSEHRLATPTEQVILSQYVGWGGLPQFFEQSNSHYNELKDLLTDSEYTSARESTLTAFYTPPTVISAVYKVLENMNFKNGNLLEPSCGIGNFIGMLPKTMQDSKIYGVELDTISAGIAQQLYQKSSIAAQGFENVNIPDSFFDGVVGNVPFGDFKVVDKKYDKHNFLIHDYFFAKSLDKLRPGGVMALITSKGTMDKENSSVRKYIAQRAELLGAIRLPNDTFKSSAGTEVVSDILFLQKRDRLIDIEPDWVHLDTNENGIRMNSYFVQNPEMVLGEMKTVSGRFGQQVTCEPYTDSNLADLLSDAIANIHGEISDYENDVATDELEEDMSIPADASVKNFSKGNVDASVDNMLKITNDGRKLALDQRMLNDMLPDFEGSKINACVDNVYRIWNENSDKKSAQLIFCDLSTPKNDGVFSVYNDIRKKLIERGIPESEVKFIHEADTDVKKKELFQKVRKGEVRVLLGSTQKMGAGTNVQDRLIALHDVDCPWRPSDLEQRAGRIIRQGNSNPEVEIYRYVTEQTFDAYLYQLVEGKQKFASQIMTSKSPVRSADDIDETALSYAEIKMLATGNPYIKEKMDLDIQIQKLKLLKANYLSEKYNLEDKIIKFYPQKIAALNNTIKALEQDLATAKAHPKPSDDSFVGIEIDGKYISEKADAGKAILEFCKQMNNPDPIAIGKYRGFDMELQFSSGVVHCYEIALKGATTQKVSLGEDANGNITRIDNAIGRLSEHIENAKVELKNIQTQYETAQIEVQKPFAQEEELKAKTKRQIEVEKLISSGENEPEQNAISDYYYFSATDEQINALNNASIPFEKQTKADGSMVIRVATDDKSKAEAIMNSKNLIL